MVGTEGRERALASCPGAPTCPTGGCSGPPSPRSSARGRARAPAPWPPTTRTPPPWASRPAAGPWPSARPAPRGPSLLHAGARLSGQDQRHHLHAALGLDRSCAAYDFCGAPRSAVGTLLMALAGARRPAGPWPSLSDLRTGLAGGAEERDTGDGAAAFLCGPDGAVAELIGRGARPATSSSTAGGCPARPTPTSGRSASARRCTSRWPARPSPTPSRTPG